MTVVLTIAPLGGTDMSLWCGGWAGRQGRVEEVPSAADLSLTAIPDAAVALDNLVHTHADDDLVVFAHSQGCQVVSAWLDKFARFVLPGDTERIRFVLTGNLERQYYGYAARKPKWIPAGNIRGLTRNDTAFTVLDIGRKGDLWANYPGGLLAMLGLLYCPAHLNYDNVDPDNLEPLSEKTVGATRYVTVA